MGEIIEWLINNFLLDVDICPDPGGFALRPLQVTCWGSYQNQSQIFPDTPQITFEPALGQRLLRGLPMVRMRNTEELRDFVINEDRMVQAGMDTAILPDLDDMDVDLSTADLLRAPVDTDVEIMDVDQIYTGHQIGPSSTGRKYRRAVRSFHNQDQGIPYWKKEYCAPVKSQRHNNRVNRRAPPPPPSPRLLPEILQPRVIQRSLFIVFLCCSLGARSNLRVNYKSGKALTFGFLLGTFVLYSLYLMFCISLKRTLKIFGTRQRTPPPNQTALPAILWSGNVQLSLLLLSLSPFLGIELGPRVRLAISVLYTLYPILYTVLKRGTGQRVQWAEAVVSICVISLVLFFQWLVT